MDFLKPRYIPMSRRRRIYEGKAKVLYEGPEPGTLIQHFKDDATAFNAKKHEVIEGIETYHPRYLVTPKVGMSFYGQWMARGAADVVRRLHGQHPFDLIDAHYVYPDGFAAVQPGQCSQPSPEAVRRTVAPVTTIR